MSNDRPLVLPSHEVLARLAREDPEALENLRRQLIDSYISSAPERMQLRLRQLQFRIDGIRITCRSPWAVNRKIHALMQEFLFRLKDKLQQFGELTQGNSALAASRPDSQDAPVRSARVIPLAPRSTDSRHTGRL
ncbi:DUF3135 domain-containing protein [Dechloromonas denitrificans]|uniref:DUF3135 domain-containing protein n=1 Tax=Dechloromonas denitrificans TaxID=281362 RepID=UPI001CF91AC6|nr:DUF3135 domain-containing protein [Dechloromonas denitrificans]UCV01726.1 DUF3135 domain-containing protein [Dechloromonas denitrificans]UCV06094.1 DUF3135 domain-containing protein [Dechloromonas denitrificans]